MYPHEEKLYGSKLVISQKLLQGPHFNINSALAQTSLDNNYVINLGATNTVSDDTVSSLRHRLKSLKDAFGDEVDDDLLAEADSLMSRTGSKSADELLRSSNRRAKRRNATNCLESIIDGSFMGGVLAVCLLMVFGAAFFAYKNLYYAVLKKMYPERDEM